MLPDREESWHFPFLNDCGEEEYVKFKLYDLWNKQKLGRKTCVLLLNCGWNTNRIAQKATRYFKLLFNFLCNETILPYRFMTKYEMFFLFIQVYNTNLFITIQLQLPYYFTPINLVQFRFNTLTQDFQYYHKQLIFVNCFYNYFLWTHKLDLFACIKLFQTIKLMQYMLLLLPYEIPTSFVKNFPFRNGVKFDRLNWGYVQKNNLFIL